MIREVALQPFFNSLVFAKTLQYLCGDASLTERLQVTKNINFSALLSNETPGQPSYPLLQMESPLEYMVHLALEMARKGSYPHEYKRERDFNLESACMHFVTLN